MSYFKFAHFTANQATLEATEIATKIHISTSESYRGPRGDVAVVHGDPLHLKNRQYSDLRHTCSFYWRFSGSLAICHWKSSP
ncbi:hypothetical protein ACFX13_019813 [Malus domestica]